MLTPTCICGCSMTFPEFKNTSHCKTQGCGVKWTKDDSGYWAEGLTKLIFTPIFAREKVCSVQQSGADRYRNYPRSKRKRKAGQRCVR